MLRRIIAFSRPVSVDVSGCKENAHLFAVIVDNLNTTFKVKHISLFKKCRHWFCCGLVTH